MQRPQPAPRQNWAAFVKTHAADTFACDFLPVVDVFFRNLYLYFIIFNHARPHPGIRQKILCAGEARASPARDKVIATSALNGLHHDYHLAA